MPKQYAVLLCVRNEAAIIHQTITSILNQTIPPQHVVVVDDGSTDSTPHVLKAWRDQIHVITRRDRGFSALSSYLLADVYNRGFHYLAQQNDWQFLLIGASDVLFPSRYMEKLLVFMGKEYAITSGKSIYTRLRSDTVDGGGRLITRQVIEGMGGGFIRSYDWESTPLRYARFKGWKVGHASIQFIERQPHTQGRSYIDWGRAMKDACYHTLAVLGRVFGSVVIEGDINKGIKLLVGYFSHPSLKDPPIWISYTKEYQKQRILSVLHKLTRHLP